MAATKTRSKPHTDGVLHELDRLEGAWAEKAEEARILGRTAHEQQQQARALTTQRQRLVAREPGLIDHLDQPLAEDNAVGKLDKQIAELGDLVDGQARLDHSRRLEAAAKDAWANHVAAHFDELLEQLRPEAEHAVEQVHHAAMELAEATERYLQLARRVDGWRGTDRTRHRLRVPGVDAGAGLKRLIAEQRDTPMPLPTEMR